MTQETPKKPTQAAENEFNRASLTPVPSGPPGGHGIIGSGLTEHPAGSFRSPDVEQQLRELSVK